mmetsp:Transcript_55986/g.177408  ORF Transcript_55986/g.177408 Transcript_55986/m.177408 type:complete len:152 (-) Transcript_55986:42-497(-)
MGDYHTYYKGPEGQTTQWDDIQTKLGNRPAKEPVWKPEGYTPEEEGPKGKERMDQVEDEEDLKELEGEYDDDRFMEEYRRQRMAELREQGKAQIYGTLEVISREDWVLKVTNAGADVWVVVFLFKDGNQYAPSPPIPPSAARKHVRRNPTS